MGQATAACSQQDYQHLQDLIAKNFSGPVDPKDVPAKLRDLGSFGLSMESSKPLRFYQRYAPSCSSGAFQGVQALKAIVCRGNADPACKDDAAFITYVKSMLGGTSWSIDQVKAVLDSVSVSHGRIETDWVRVGLAAAVLLLLLALMARR